MNTDLPLKLQSLEQFPVLMTKEMVADALGLARHIIPPLTRAGLIKALGRPQRYCVKHYSREALAKNFADPEWLERVAAAVHRHWRMKNAHKRSKQAGNPSPAGGSVAQ